MAPLFGTFPREDVFSKLPEMSNSDAKIFPPPNGVRAETGRKVGKVLPKQRLLSVYFIILFFIYRFVSLFVSASYVACHDENMVLVRVRFFGWIDFTLAYTKWRKKDSRNTEF